MSLVAQAGSNSGPGPQGGRQRIPRPEGFVVGDPSPWAGLTPAQRRFNIADVRAALTGLPAPRPASEHPFHEIVADRTLRSGAGALRDAAVLLVLFEERGEARLVLTRRPDHLPTHQGDIAFPGGKLEPVIDADAAAAALREAHEEIGLAPESVELVAELDHLPSVGGPFAIAPFVGIVAGRPELTPAPGEVDRVFDVALSELLDPDAHHLERWNRFGSERTMYFFDVAGETVWGATALMVAVFLGLVTGVDVVVS